VQQHLVAGPRVAEHAPERAALLVEQVRHVRDGRTRRGIRQRDRGLSPVASAHGRGRRRAPSLVVAGAGRRIGAHQRPFREEPAQAGGGEAGGGAQLPLPDAPGLFDERERAALPGSQPRRGLRTPSEGPVRGRDADDAGAVGHPQPASAAVTLVLGRERAGRETDAAECAQSLFPGRDRRCAGLRELVPAIHLERSHRRTHQRQRSGEGGEIVTLHAAGEIEQPGRHWRHVQHVVQRQYAPLVAARVADLEHHADHRARAQRCGHERSGLHRRREVGGHLVVEGLGEGPRADQREDGGVAHAAPPSARRGLSP